MSRLSRRRMLQRSSALGGACAGYAVLGNLLPSLVAASAEPHPLVARRPHFAPKARRAIMFFLTGGMSHVDSFDPKPELQRRGGETFRHEQRLVSSPWRARPRGAGGVEMTDLFPAIAEMADDICLIRSMYGDHNDHFEATLHMHTGSEGDAKPSLGAWLSYGLGTENTNLPSHVVFAQRTPYAGAQVWDSNFLPAYHQGVRITPGEQPIPHLTPQPDTPWSVQSAELEMLRRVNARHLATRSHDSELAARMLSFDTATSLQRLAPQLFDLSGESDATHALYGLERGDTTSFAWQTLTARRMLEAGVRFVELIDTGSNSNWDAHGKIQSHEKHARKIDRPIAGLLNDLKQRGLFDDTLVIFCTEFGRTPFGQNNGRNHHCKAFSCWLAGGGVNGGYAHGTTDELGMEVASDGVHVHDFHATILYLMGLDHERLTYRHAGRDFRLTDVYGDVVQGILA